MNKSILDKFVAVKTAPDGSEYRSLPMKAVRKIADKEKTNLRDVEIMALEAGVIPEHYQRNIGLLGFDGQIKLLRSHVGIAGAGGLGGAVFEILARFGVGQITIADFDAFEESNLNRQLLSSIERLGKKKADTAAAHVMEINPSVSVTSINERLTTENAPVFFKNADIIIDALGNVRDRFITQDAARTLEIPFVHAAVAGASGQISVIFPEDAGLESIYGPKESIPVSGRELREGTPPSSVLSIAALEANEAVKVITQIAPIHLNTLMLVDLNDLSIRKFSLPGK